jgi:hypothetical protein
MVSRCDDSEWDMLPVDAIYPVEDNAVEIAPAEIRDWLSVRRGLLDIWRASYEEFGQQFIRNASCPEFGSLVRLW